MNMHLATNARIRRTTTPSAYLVDHFSGMLPSTQPAKAVLRCQNRSVNLEAWRPFRDGRKYRTSSLEAETECVLPETYV